MRQFVSFLGMASCAALAAGTAALAGAAAAQPAPGPAPKGNHYQCYPAEQQEKPVPRSVALADQFGKREVALGAVVRLCNPVEKRAKEGSGPIVDRTLHLVCYRYAAQQAPRVVRVRNQFGVLTLKVGQPGELCLPSSKVIVK